MKIFKAHKESEYQRLNFFFGKMWKEEFNLDRFNKIEDYENGTNYYIKDGEEIISAINLFKADDGETHIGRIGTLTDYRGKGLGTSLINFSIEALRKEGEKELFITAEIKKLEYYNKLGFQEMGETEKIGNTSCVKMKKNLA